MLVLRADRAFDGDRLRTGGVAVYVEDGRIVGVEDARREPPAGVPVVAYPDATVLPGLVDAHVHLNGDGTLGALDRLPSYDRDGLAAIMEESLRAHLVRGVTTVRDLGDRTYAVLERREVAGAGPRPTIVAAGPPITVPRGHCWYMGGEVNGPEAIRIAVAERAERGVDVVKVMATGGTMTPDTDVTASQFPVDELRLIVELAHAAGLPVTAHAHALQAAEEALDAGVDGLEHGTCLTADGPRRPEAFVRRLAASRVAVCPTLGYLELDGQEPPPGVARVVAKFGLGPDSLAAAAAELHAAGVVIAMGTDGGISPAKPHGLQADAAVRFARGGAAGEATLATATSAAADAVGLGDRKGRLRPGYDADLLVVAGDPAADLAALNAVTAVYVGGAEVEPLASE